MKLTIDTPRLRLVAGTSEIAYAAVYEPDLFATLLGADVPEDWPPAIMADMELYYAGTLVLFPDQAGWWIWYVILKGEGERTDTLDTLIGAVSFKGTPLDDGEIEIGYSLLPAWHGFGYATEASSALIDWAFCHPEVSSVVAEADEGHGASLRVMEKCGLSPAGEGSAPELVRFARRKGG